MCCWLCLILDSLFFSTLTLVVGLIFVLIIIIGGMLCSTLFSNLVWLTIFITKACSFKSQSTMQFQHIAILHVQLHHCLSLHSIPHGFNNIEVKQITKQNLYLWILSLILPIPFNEHVISPHICIIHHVFGLTDSSMFFPIPFVINYKDNLVYIVSPSLWFDVRRFQPHQQPCLDTRSPHHFTNKCFPRFHNYCKQLLYSTSCSSILGIIGKIYYIIFGM